MYNKKENPIYLAYFSENSTQLSVKRRKDKCGLAKRKYCMGSILIKIGRVLRIYLISSHYVERILTEKCVQNEIMHH